MCFRYNAFEAAAQAGCQRLIFASSVHAMLGYASRKEITSYTNPVNPPNIYVSRSPLPIDHCGIAALQMLYV
jgi:nucleoside-diphosphate-sugar epimerase